MIAFSNSLFSIAYKPSLLNSLSFLFLSFILFFFPHFPNREVIFLLYNLYHRPNQPLDVIHDYLIDRLSGEKAPKLHLVLFNSKEEAEDFRDLVTDCCGHLHSYSSSLTQTAVTGDETRRRHSVEDSDIVQVEEEIVKAQRILNDLKSLDQGIIGASLIEILREVSSTALYAHLFCTWVKFGSVLNFDFSLKLPVIMSASMCV